jgi:hypothetical protein
VKWAFDRPCLLFVVLDRSSSSVGCPRWLVIVVRKLNSSHAGPRAGGGLGRLRVGGRRWSRRAHGSYLVDPASSHMLVSKIKPCMSKHKPLHGEAANGSLGHP